MAESGNGTTFSFGGVQGDVRSVSFNTSAAEINTTVLSDTSHKYEAGLPDNSIDVETVGASTIDVGDINPLTVNYLDVGNIDDTLASAVCTSKSIQNDLDAEITTSLTFKEAR